MKTKFGITFGIVLILIALILILSALGIVPEYISKIIISWRFLIFIIGVKLLLMGNYTPGFILTIISTYFTIPYIYKITGTEMPISKENMLVILVALLLVVFAFFSIMISFKWMPNTKSLDRKSVV